MVNRLEEHLRDDGQLQDVELQRLQRQAREFDEDASRGRRVSLKAMRVHHLHLQNGQPYDAGCRVCTEGLEGILAPVAVNNAQLRLDEDRRVNEERAAALARDRGTDPWPDEVLRR